MGIFTSILSYEIKKIFYSKRFKIAFVLSVLIPMFYTYIATSEGVTFIERNILDLEYASNIILYILTIGTASTIYSYDFEMDIVDLTYSQPISRLNLFLTRITALTIAIVLIGIIGSLSTLSTIYLISRLSLPLTINIVFIISLIYSLIVISYFTGLFNVLTRDGTKTIIFCTLLLGGTFLLDIFTIHIFEEFSYIEWLLPYYTLLIPLVTSINVLGVSSNIHRLIYIFLGSLLYLIVSLYILLKAFMEYEAAY